MLKLTSLQNPKIKYLSKLINRRTRDKTGKTLLEGYRLITRALEADYPIEECYFCPPLFLGKNENQLINELKSQNIQVIEVTEQIFKKIAYRDRPEGLIALTPIKKHLLNDMPLIKNGLYLVVEAIEKPGNLGSILRSADAAGASGLIICNKCTDLYNPNVLRASTGAVFFVPIAECSSEDAHTWLKKNNIKTLAATPHTKTSYAEINMTESIAIITGTEQYGLSDYWLKNADIEVLIPMCGKIDSLNVAIATSILLFEASRQRQHISPQEKI